MSFTYFPYLLIAGLLLTTCALTQKSIKYIFFTLIIMLFFFEVLSQLMHVNEIKTKNSFAANLIKNDKKRFIAHGAGRIDGKTYTNSLEAMNDNYKKGFKLFELDIIKTSDDFFVAAHDWKLWAKQTQYKGELPPNRDTFLKLKIYNKYMPMDMDVINAWFKLHHDAILVTDKVNLPKEFSMKFIDKNRLMMELFTWDAVKEGLNLKIKSSMPTGRLLFSIHGDKVQFLKKLKITDIATSHRLINHHKKLMKQIVRAGIKFYAFHLNSKDNKDEKHIVCAEHQFFYGIYADKWNFTQVIKC